MARSSTVKIGTPGEAFTTGLVEQPPIAGGVSKITPPAVEIGAQKSRQMEEEVRSIVTRLSTLAQEQVTAKKEIEERAIEDMRAFHGFYDPQTELALKNGRQSRAYIKATRAKTTALEARLFDMIFPTDDKNWGITPTPVPKLAKEAAEAKDNAAAAAEEASRAEAEGNTQGAQAAIAAGNDQAARADKAHEIILQANRAAALMEQEMDDQLVESQYPQESRDMIRDACILGTGILKGPLVNESSRGQWVKGESNVYQLEHREDPRPLVRRVDWWSFFPDMSARRIGETEFTFERYLWTKKDLRKMVKTHGFDPDGVRELLRDDSKKSKATGSAGLNYLTQLRSITGEGSASIKGRYIGWEYHGPLECDEVCTLLRALGKEDVAEEYATKDDPLEEFRVIAYFCEDQLLKIAPEYPLDSGETLYSIFNIEESEASIFGYGIPHIMGDSQQALNSAWRMALDNGGLSVGPQSVIAKDEIQPANGIWNMEPKKVWWRTKAAVPNAPDPITFFNVPNNMAEIEAIIKLAIDFIDMETGIPMPQQGDNGAHTTQTVGGMAILQNASNIIFRRIVKNYDDGIITPTMRRLYDWNMQHNTREDVKGDMSIDARGTSVLLVKEIQAQNLMFVVSQLLASPQIAPMLKAYPNVKKLFQSMMISPDEVMETEDDYKANVQKLQEAQAQQENPVVIQAKSRIEAANIQAKSRAISDETSKMIEEMRQRTALVELASREGLTVEQLKTELAIAKERSQSEERKLAVEIGTEMQLAEDARAHGEDPTGSGGYVSAGVEDKKKAA